MATNGNAVAYDPRKDALKLWILATTRPDIFLGKQVSDFKNASCLVGELASFNTTDFRGIALKILQTACTIDTTSTPPTPGVFEGVRSLFQGNLDTTGWDPTDGHTHPGVAEYDVVINSAPPTPPATS